MTTKVKKPVQERVLARLNEIRERGGFLQRDASLGGIDQEARTCEISFSSEAEYERWFGVEILGHDATECDLVRLNNDAAMLWMHNWDDQRGVIEQGTARIDADRKGRCVVRFSKSAEGEKLFQEVIDRIVTKVSVGYMVNGMRWVEEREGGLDVYRVTSWQPYEVSFVSIPADDSVGVGRTLEKPQEEPAGQSAQTAKRGGPESGSTDNSTRKTENMNIRTLRDGAGNLVRAEVDDQGNITKVLEIIERAGDDQRSAEQRGLTAERERVNGINALADTYGHRDVAARMITEGKTTADFQRELLHLNFEQRSQRSLGDQVQDANLGMSRKDIQHFSMFRVMRHLTDPANDTFRKAASFELDCSRAAAEKYGKNPKGVLIPNDVLADRAFATGGGSGATLVGQQHLAGSFIELLVKRTWLLKRARTLAGLVGNVDIPRKSGKSTAYWVGEGTAPTGSAMTTDQVVFSPKTVGAFTDITRRLLLQSTPDAESLVRDDLLESLGLEIDRVGIYGTGSDFQPKGLKNITGLAGVDLATQGKPTFGEIIQLETEVSSANADVGNMSYVHGAKMRGHFKSTLKFAENGAATIWEQGNTINGYATDVTNQIDDDEIFFGNWNDLVVAFWGGLELTVDPYSLSTSGGLRIVALQDCDINVRHLQSFAYGSHLVEVGP